MENEEKKTEQNECQRYILVITNLPQVVAETYSKIKNRQGKKTG